MFDSLSSSIHSVHSFVLCPSYRVRSECDGVPVSFSGSGAQEGCAPQVRLVFKPRWFNPLSAHTLTLRGEKARGSHSLVIVVFSRLLFVGSYCQLEFSLFLSHGDACEYIIVSLSLVLGVLPCLCSSRLFVLVVGLITL